MNLPIKRLKDVPLPSYAYHGDAAVDLYAAEDMVLASGAFGAVPTGLAVAVPEGYAGLIWDKSGLAIKQGLKTLGGVVDAGYRGEIMVGIINLGSEAYTFTKGQKVAQLIVQKVERPEIIEVEELPPAERGDRGFGSSGLI